MNNDPEDAELPEEIALAAYDGNFERVKAWLAGGSASDPRSVNATNDVGWTLLMNIATSDAMTPEHVEFARYLISRGAAIDIVARGRVKLPSRTRRRSPRGRDARQKRALEFVVRQGDNGIVWNILSFWRETA